MAQYTLTHTCGHSQTHKLFGSHKDRDSKLSWLATTLCYDCYKAEQDAKKAVERAAALTEAKSEATQLSLPELTGSEKQISWAMTLRDKALKALDVYTDRINTNAATRPCTSDSLTAAISVVAAIAQDLATQTSSRWWIDNCKDAESYVDCRVRTDLAVHPVTVAYRAQKEAEKAAESARIDAEREAQAAKEREEAENAQVETDARAKTFSVRNNIPDAVTAEVGKYGDGNWTAQSRDGRIAKGYIGDGEWVTLSIGDYQFATAIHPELDRIGREARAQWKRQQAENSNN